MASILEKLGDFEKAEKILKRLADDHLDDFSLQQLYKDFSARATIHRGNYQKAASSSGSYRDALKDIGQTQAGEREERVQKTEAVLDQMIQEKEAHFQENTENLRLAVEIGRMNIQRKNFDRAIEYFNYVATNGMAGDTAIDKLISDTHLSRFDHQIKQLNPDAANYQQEKKRLEGVRADFELENCRKSAEKYPTDMEIRYEFGEWMSHLNTFVVWRCLSLQIVGYQDRKFAYEKIRILFSDVLELGITPDLIFL